MGSLSSLHAKFASRGGGRSSWVIALPSAAIVFGEARSAAAYQTDSVATDPCHETITADALRTVRAELPDAARLDPGNKDERALLDDLPFALASDMHDFGTVSMILGNRDIDLKGHAPDDLNELSPISADPRLQPEHCLRRPEQDEPNGSEDALVLCRETLRIRARRALDALMPDSSSPDPNKRETVKVFLELRGAVDVDLPVYHVELGRALHTLQDSFSHSYRDPADQTRITEVLNYVDVAEDRLNEAVDGPPHNTSLDHCQGLDAFRQERLGLATQASAELISATLSPDLTLEQKQQGVDQVIERYVTLEQKGCTSENTWCDAPEKRYAEDRGCVCGFGRGSSAGGGGFSAFVALAALGWHRSRRRRETAARRSRRPELGERCQASKRALVGGALVGGALIVLLPATAFADERSTPAPAARAPSAGVLPSRSITREASGATSTPSASGFTTREPQADTQVVDATPDTPERTGSRFGVLVAGAGAVENGALAASVGGVYRLSPRWLLGIDIEYNPWYSIRDFDLKPGATNLYASGVVRFPLHYQRVNLRSTLQLGASRMNFGLFGVPEGSIGPFVGFNLLGVDYEMARSLYLIINPAHIAVPIPKVSGVPFYYPQYRFTIGLQFGA